MADINCLRLNYEKVMDMVKRDEVEIYQGTINGKLRAFKTNILCGEGAYKKVYLAIKLGEENKLLVWSEIDLSSITKTEQKRVRNEIEIGLFIRDRSNSNNIKVKNLVKTIAGGLSGDKKKVVNLQEFINNGSLSDLIIEKMSIHNYLSPKIINKLLKDILIGLHNLHHNIGIIHRDIKPANILIQNKDDHLEYNFDSEYEDLDRVFTTKICDFGLSSKIHTKMPSSLVFPKITKATTVDTNIARAGELLIGGTPNYMAPEITSGNYDSKVDIYSLGWTLFSLISFKSSFNPKIEKFKDINEGGKVAYQNNIYKLYGSDSQLDPDARIMDLEYCKISNGDGGDNCFPIMNEINELFKVDGIYRKPFKDNSHNYLNFFNDCISSPNNRLDSASLLRKYFQIEILSEERLKYDPFAADDEGHYSAFG